jgi:hypothetical protein
MTNPLYGCEALSGEPFKVVLLFPNTDSRNLFISETFRLPATKRRLWIEEVSLIVKLRETTDVPPAKAFAYLETGQVEVDETNRFNLSEPLGIVQWLDKSPPPNAGTSTGMLRTTLSTFIDQSSPVTASGEPGIGWFPFVKAILDMNENIELAFAGEMPLSHVTIVGCLVELPTE